jgi:hypothetical protein
MRRLIFITFTLSACVLPPIRRVEPIDVPSAQDVADNDVFEASDGDQDVPSAVDVRSDTYWDVPQPRDVPTGADGGIVLPAVIAAVKAFDFPAGAANPFTAIAAGSKIVANRSHIVATAWINLAGAPQNSQRIFSRTVADPMWRQAQIYQNVSTPSSLAMDQQDNHLFVGISCQDNCSGRVTVMPPGTRQSGIIQFNERRGMDYDYATPSAVTFDTGGSYGFVTVSGSRRTNEYYWSHMALIGAGPNAVRRFWRSGAGMPEVLDGTANGLWPLIDFTETTVDGAVYHAISGTMPNNVQPEGFVSARLYSLAMGTLTETVPFMPTLMPGAVTRFPLYVASVESSPNSTLYLYLHGQFGLRECSRLYRKARGDSLDYVSLGCHSPEAQLHIIDDDRLLFVEPIGGATGMRIGYSSDQGSTWTWRDVRVTLGGSATDSLVFAAPSLVRPSTSPNGFLPNRVRMVFSVGSGPAGSVTYTGMAYAEIALQ